MRACTHMQTQTAFVARGRLATLAVDTSVVAGRNAVFQRLRAKSELNFEFAGHKLKVHELLLVYLFTKR